MLFRQGCFRFRHVDYRHQTTEQQEQSKEQTKRSDQHRPIDPGRFKVGPSTGQIISRERGDRDHKPFKPHADVHKDTDQNNDPRRGTELLDPKQLRTDHITRDHGPISPPIRAERPVGERELLFGHLAVPSDKEFGSISQANNRARRQNDLAHIVEVPNRDQFFQPQHRAGGHHQRQHHRKSAEDRSCNKVGRKDRRVPSGNL